MPSQLRQNASNFGRPVIQEQHLIGFAQLAHLPWVPTPLPRSRFYVINDKDAAATLLSLRFASRLTILVKAPITMVFKVGFNINLVFH